MSLSRIVLYSAAVLLVLVLVLVLVLGAGIFAYHNLPALVEQQVKSQLRDYGVQQLRYQQPEVSLENLNVDQLRLNGVYRGMPYQAAVSGLSVAYSWQSLLAGKVGALSMAGLEIVITQSQARPQPRSEPATTVKLSSWLPGRSGDGLPLESLDITRWHVTYQSPGRPSIEATGSVQFNQQLKLQLQSSYLGSQLAASLWTEGSGSLPRAQMQLEQGDVTVATLSAKANHADADQWQWAMQGELEFAPMLSWLRRLEQQGAALNLDLPDGLDIAGGSILEAQISHPDALLLSTASTQELLSQLTVDATSDSHIDHLDYGGWFSKLTGDVAIAFKLSAGKYHASMGPAELQGRLQTDVLSLPAEARAWLGWGEFIPVRWRSPQHIALAPLADQPWPLRVRDNLLVIGNEDSQLRLDAAQLDAAIDPVTGLPTHANLRARVDVRLQQTPMPPMQLALAHSGALEQGEFSAVLNADTQSMSLVLGGEGDLRNGSGRWRAVLDSPELAVSSAVVVPLLQDFGVLSKRHSPVITVGKMRLDTELHSQSYSLDQLEQRSYLAADKLSGQYQGYAFENLGVSADWVGVEQWRTTRPVRLKMARLNTGVELRNITARLSLPVATPVAGPKISIDSFAGQILGGWIRLPEPRSWDFAAASNSLTLQVERWRLADLVALQQEQDIKADGILDGELPLTLSGGRVIIADGYLRALAPGGRIQYRASEATRAMAADSKELQSALELLADFRYQQLASEVQLDAAGKLLLGLSLVGKNPMQYQGRPINFNINLEQNIDPLLQSLRLSGNLVDKLEDRVK